MSEMIALEKNKSKLRFKYTKYTKIFLIISLIFVLWIVFDYLGILVYGLGPDWALISLEYWIIIGCVVFALFIVLELVFLFSYQSKKTSVKKLEEEFFNGKRVHIFTHPQGSMGGIFSKTYIDVDGNTVIRLRNQMASAGDLWKKEE